MDSKKLNTFTVYKAEDRIIRMMAKLDDTQSLVECGVEYLLKEEDHDLGVIWAKAVYKNLDDFFAENLNYVLDTNGVAKLTKGYVEQQLQFWSEDDSKAGDLACNKLLTISIGDWEAPMLWSPAVEGIIEAALGIAWTDVFDAY